LLVVATMICTPVSPVYASDSRRQPINEHVRDAFDIDSLNFKLDQKSLSVDIEVLGKINSDIARMSVLGLVLTQDIINSIKVIDYNEIQYTVVFESITNTITVCTREQESYSLRIQQGEIEDHVTCYLDGTVYVDGVQINNTSTESRVTVPTVTRGTDYFTTYPLYGTSADYKYFGFTDSNSNIALTKQIINLSLGTFIIIIGAFLPPLVGALYSFVALFYTTFQQNVPNTTSLSYMAPVEFMNSGTSWIPAIQGWAWEYNFTFYSNANYLGLTSSNILYRLNV